MCEFSKWLRRELQLSGVPGTTIMRIEIVTARTWGGSRPYIGKLPEMIREQRQSLIRAGVPPRTATRKITGR